MKKGFFENPTISPLGVSKNRGRPKSSIGFSIINHPFWATPIFWKHPYDSGLPSPLLKGMATIFFFLIEVSGLDVFNDTQVWQDC